MTDKQNFEKDIDVLSKRLDRIDKMEIDLASYEQKERDIEKIIEPYQLDWELDCLSLPSAIQSVLERKEQECEELKDLANHNGRVCNERLDKIDELEHVINELNGQLDQLKQTLTEIKEIARVNSINTCWTAINLCVDCEEIGECGLQSPFEKLKAIIQIISECEVK